MAKVVFFAIALIVFGAPHAYLWMRLVRDAALPGPWKIGLSVLLGAMCPVLMVGTASPPGLPLGGASPIAWIAFTWLGVLFFLLVTVAVTDLVRFFVVKAVAGPDNPERRLAISRVFAGVAAFVGIGASGVGLASALGPVAVRRVKVSLAKLAASTSGYRIVQISDVHVGPTIGKRFIEEIVARINALSPDLVAITGDLVDGSVDELREHVAPLANLKAKDGVFFVTGNHEYYHNGIVGGRAADQWVAHLLSLGIRVLRNEHVKLAGFDLAGIDDASHGADLEKALENRDFSRPVVLLAHQPKGIEKAAALGVDLQLSGHTHGGQLFPWGLLVRLQQPFVEGLHRLAKSQIYVSRGTGYWGPPMRVGAPAEITEIELSA